MGWDEPVSVAAVNLPNNGSSTKANRTETESLEVVKQERFNKAAILLGGQ
ncbi:MAG: hypothetical protein Q7T02_01050 [Pseudomonas sp.]|nr:hypothetical protein [Pseudomonas sp.]MDO9322406.1 hypothetical protein [Pseudomonas sp.]